MIMKDRCGSCRKFSKSDIFYFVIKHFYVFNFMFVIVDLMANKGLSSKYSIVNF